MPTKLLLAHPDFQTFGQPCSTKIKYLSFSITYFKCLIWWTSPKFCHPDNVTILPIFYFWYFFFIFRSKITYLTFQFKMNLLYDHSRLVWKFSTIVYVVWWWWCCCLVQCAAESPRRSFLKRNSKRCARNSIGQKLDEDFTNLMWSSWIIRTLPSTVKSWAK